MGQKDEFCVINQNDWFCYCIDCVYELVLVLSSALELVFYFKTSNCESSTT